MIGREGSACCGIFKLCLAYVLVQGGGLVSPIMATGIRISKERDLSGSGLDSSLIWFIHIPKTAGTSFSMALLSAYKESEILPGSGISCGFDGSRPLDLDFRRAKIAFSHTPLPKAYSFGVEHSRSLSGITFLRDTIDHRISYYLEKVYDHGLGHDTPTEWINTREYAHILGYQMRQLSCCKVSQQTIPMISAEMEEKEMIKCPRDIACRNSSILQDASSKIKNMRFFGLVERYEDSLCLFSHVFSRQIKSMGNYRVRENRPHLWKETDISKLRELEKVEIKFLEFARKLFDMRVRHAMAEAFERNQRGKSSPYLCKRWADKLGISNGAGFNVLRDEKVIIPEHAAQYTCEAVGTGGEFEYIKKLRYSG